MDRYINIIKKVQIPNSQFSHIIYIPKKGDDIIIEDTTSGKHLKVDSHYIKNYIKIDDTSLPFTKLITGDYVGVDNNRMTICTPITTKIEKHWIRIRLNYDVEDIPEDVKTNVNINIIDTDQFEFNVPVLPIWARFINCENSKQEEYSIQRVCMEYNNKFYRVPFGNISSADSICMGGLRLYKSKEHFLYNFLTMPFQERDYGCLLKNTVITKHHTFDLESIGKIIDSNGSISVFSMLYYIANIEDIESFDYDKVFYRRTAGIWDIE